MAISHGAATRTVLCDAAVDRVDANGNFGKLQFLTAADALLAVGTLLNPAFGAASGATALLLGVPISCPVTAGGTIAKFRFVTQTSVTVIEGSVGTSGQDINLSSVVVSVNDVIQVDAISYTSAV
jgi:hypothetical protein